MSNASKRTSSDKSKPEAERTPATRFRIQKLEERIAPKKGGNGTNNCGGGSGSGTSSGLSGGSAY